MMIRNQRAPLRLNTPVGKSPAGVPVSPPMGTGWGGPMVQPMGGYMGPMGGPMAGNMGGYMGPMSSPPVQPMGGQEWAMTPNRGSVPNVGTMEGTPISSQIGRQPAPAKTPPVATQPGYGGNMGPMVPPMATHATMMTPPMATQGPPQQTGIAGGFQGNGMGPSDQRQMLAAILANGSMGTGIGSGRTAVLAPMATAQGPAMNPVLGALLARRGQ